jgi:hypothetical protein
LLRIFAMPRNPQVRIAYKPVAWLFGSFRASSAV